MNDNVVNKIDSLLKDAEAQKNSVVSSSKLVSIVYVLLAVFVFVYTTILYVKIRAGVKNDSISAIAKNLVSEQLSNVPKMLDDLVDSQAEGLADSMVALIYDQIPTIEQKAKEMVNEYSGSMISQIKTDLFPQFHQIIRDNADDVKVAAEALSDENATKELAKMMVKKISEEIDYSHGLITSEAQGTVNDITKHFSEILKKPAGQLTNKEASQKRLIVNWLYLIDREQGLDKIFKTIINRTGYSWEHFMQELGIADAVKETMGGDTGAVDVEE